MSYSSVCKTFYVYLTYGCKTFYMYKTYLSSKAEGVGIEIYNLRMLILLQETGILALYQTILTMKHRI